MNVYAQPWCLWVGIFLGCNKRIEINAFITKNNLKQSDTDRYKQVHLLFDNYMCRTQLAFYFEREPLNLSFDMPSVTSVLLVLVTY